jgi:tetratricopeptide (TPR) repeat protein
MLVAGVAIGLSIAAGAGGQEADQPHIGGPAMMAHRAAELARAALLGPTEPKAHQITQARVLLEQAVAVDPNALENWRLAAEAAAMDVDRDAVTTALKRYLRLAPGDDRAQYQFVQILVARQQTVEKRVALLTRIADGQSGKFSRALRSRAAFDAAMLAREQGDTAEHIRLLGKAVALDETNKAAAGQAYLRLLDTGAPVGDVGAALFTLFSADPTDASVHATIADLLSAGGQYDQALPWYASHAGLMGRMGQPVSIEVASAWSRAMWGSGKLDEALGILSDIDRAYDLPPSPDEPDAEPKRSPDAPAVWPPVQVELLRLAMHVTAGNQPAVDATLQRVADVVGKQLADEPDNPVAAVNLVWAQLLAGKTDNATAGLIDKLAKAQLNPAKLASVRGWAALRGGDATGAVKRLEPLADAESSAAYGLSLAHAAASEPAKQAAVLRQMAKMMSGDMFSLMAAADARRLGLTTQPEPEVADLGRVFGQIPRELRDIAMHANQFVMLGARMDQREYSYGMPMELTLALRNVSRVPLGLGAGQAVGGQVTVVPTVTLNGQDGPQLRPIVVNMDRQLRLEPRRSVEVKVRLDSGDLGALLDASPGAMVKINAVLMLNPRLTPNGRLVPGVLGDQTTVRSITRRNWMASDENLNNALAQVGSGDAGQAM